MSTDQRGIAQMQLRFSVPFIPNDVKDAIIFRQQACWHQDKLGKAAWCLRTKANRSYEEKFVPQ